MQRLTHWFEDHLPLRRRPASRRADSIVQNNINSTTKIDYLSSFKAGLANSISKPKNVLSSSYYSDKSCDSPHSWKPNTSMWQSMTEESQINASTRLNKIFHKTSRSEVPPPLQRRNNQTGGQHNVDQKNIVSVKTCKNSPKLQSLQTLPNNAISSKSFHKSMFFIKKIFFLIKPFLKIALFLKIKLLIFY